MSTFVDSSGSAAASVNNSGDGTVAAGTYLMYLRTVQSSIFRMLTEGLKEILQDCNVTFNASGIRITTFTASHTVLVHLKLNADKFDEYSCPEPLTLGLNIGHLHALLRNIHNNDTLTMSVSANDPMNLNIKNESGEKDRTKVTKYYRLNLLTLEDDEFEIPPVQFPLLIKIPTVDLQKTFREMKARSTFVEIACVSRKLILRCESENSDMEVVMDEGCSDGMTYVTCPEDTTQVIQGTFSLKELVLFTKCVNLCEFAQMYMDNDNPLIFVYEVGNLGQLRFGLAPKKSNAR